MPSSDTTPSHTAARRSSSVALLLVATLLAACSGLESATSVSSPTTAALSQASPAGESDDSTSDSTDSADPSEAPSTTEAPTTTTEATTTSTTIAPDALPLPIDETGLGAAISEAELAIRDEANSTDEARRWGRRLQLLYRQLADNEDWAPAVLAAADPAIAADVESNWSARQHLSALVASTKLAENMPAWRIDEPLPVDELLAAYRSAESSTGVPWEILASINFVETRMGRIEGLSTAGAVGPMQFLPSTWEGCCEGDPTIDADAIQGAAIYLTLVGAPDDIDAALFSYNRSNDYVEAVKDYAAVMERNELAYRGYHAYEVFFRSAEGLVVLEPGYYEPEPIDAAAWIAANPEALIAD